MSPEQVPRVIVRSRIDRVNGDSFYVSGVPAGRSSNDLRIVPAAFVQKFGEPTAEIRIDGILVKVVDRRSKKPLTDNQIEHLLDRLLKKDKQHGRAQSA